MSITASQISLVLSGGSGNNDPSLSLGGQPSAFPVISGELNNLFEDATSDETGNELDQFRCLYVFNDGEETVYNLSLWIDSQSDGGSTIQLGMLAQDEVQRLTIQGVVTSGTITLSYNSKLFTTNYDSDINVWANNIAVSMNGLLGDDAQPILYGVSVTGIVTGSNKFFDIVYSGIDGKKDQPLIEVVSTDLLPTPVATVSLLFQGNPVNTVAGSLDVETTPPGGITFFIPTSDSPLSIMKLGPNEGFPFWVERITPVDAGTLDNDNAILKIRIESLKPIG